jgi:hypothetical protein
LVEVVVGVKVLTSLMALTCVALHRRDVGEEARAEEVAEVVGA